MLKGCFKLGPSGLLGLGGRFLVTNGIKSVLSSSTHRHLSTNETKTTCLIDFHRKRKARMELFAGYMMPIVYGDQSIKSEHLQTRSAASVFDVSHMMQTLVKGKDRCKFVESLTVADVESMGLNKCTLSVFTNATGGIIDDCIVSKRDDDLFIVSNAGNAEIIWTWLNEQLSNRFDVELERLYGRGLVALQGPEAAKVLQRFTDVDLNELEFMNTTNAKVDSFGRCQVTRCGYTGEDGFEISVSPDSAEALMDMLCQQDDVKPAGLGARDTLRLEAGLCLHGHDITDKTTPVEAALNWTIHKRRRLQGGFLGSDIIMRQIKDGCQVKRIGLIATSHGPPAREGSVVRDVDGTELGVVTSGTYGPNMERNIAMAYIPASLASSYDRPVTCEIRGKKFPYKLTKMPFVKARYYFKGK